MKNKTVSQLWEYYRTKVLAPGAPPAQVSECQMAFYAGASSMIGEMITLADFDITEDEGAARFDKFVDELHSFVALL